MLASLHSPRGLLVVVSAAWLCWAAGGCSVLSNVAYWVKGNKVAAKFKGLEGKRVAVVCLDPHSLGGPGGEADALARVVNVALAHNVPKVAMVRQGEIADWIDNQNQDVTDYRDVGRGVKADMVVGIDLISFNIHEGQTLLRGKAQVRVRVYDMTQGGTIVHEEPAKEVAWPENGARHVTENEANFKIHFLSTLAHKIARDFYAYDAIEDYGMDAAHLAN